MTYLRLFFLFSDLLFTCAQRARAQPQTWGDPQTPLDYPYRIYSSIISDNFSTDGTRELLKKKFSRNPVVTLYFQEENLGARKNFLFLLSKASSEWFMFLGSDDEISKSFFPEVISAIQSNPQAAMILPQVHYRRGDRFYKGAQESVGNGGSSSRILKYLMRVKDNGRFYNVSKTADAFELLEFCSQLDTSVGFDHCYMLLRHACIASADAGENCIVIRELGRGSALRCDKSDRLKYCRAVFFDSMCYLKNMLDSVRFLIDRRLIGWFVAGGCVVAIFSFHVVKRNLGVAGSLFIKGPIRDLYNQGVK